eukprot:g14191.t1
MAKKRKYTNSQPGTPKLDEKETGDKHKKTTQQRAQAKPHIKSDLTPINKLKTWPCSNKCLPLRLPHLSRCVQVPLPASMERPPRVCSASVRSQDQSRCNQTILHLLPEPQPDSTKRRPIDGAPTSVSTSTQLLQLGLPLSHLTP